MQGQQLSVPLRDGVVTQVFWLPCCKSRSVQMHHQIEMLVRLVREREENKILGKNNLGVMIVKCYISYRQLNSHSSNVDYILCVTDHNGYPPLLPQTPFVQIIHLHQNLSLHQKILAQTPHFILLPQLRLLPLLHIIPLSIHAQLVHLPRRLR